MHRTIFLNVFAWSLIASGCGDGDVLPVARDDSSRDRASARAEEDTPDERGHESDVHDEPDSGSEDAPSTGEAPDGGPEAGAGLDASAAEDSAVGSDSGETAALAPDGDLPAEDAGGATDAGGSMGGGDSAASPDAGADADLGNRLTYYRDAKPILDAKCTPCHYEGGIGPFPLTAYDEVRPYGYLIKSDVAAGIMPPWRASGPLDVYLGDRRLSDAQKDTLIRWVDDGALAGNPSDAPPPVPPDRRGLDRVDLTLPIGGPYTPTLVPDEYRCFVMEWPYSTTKYVTGMNIVPQRSQSVHHAILYLESPENAASVRAQDRADPGPGFTCFSNLSSLTTWLTSYEPGGYGQTVPGGLGFEVRPGSLMVLQIHYNSQNGVGPDSSHVEFQIADRIDRVGSVQQLLNSLWVAGLMSIPANVADTVHSWRGRPSGLSSFSSYDIHWVDLHMHTLGSRGRVSIVRSGLFGRVEPLLDIPDWDFNWQQTYIFRQPVRLNPGDELQVECHFDNTAANQQVVNGQRLTPRNVNWGEGTTDEMCLGNVLTTPAR